VDREEVNHPISSHVRVTRVVTPYYGRASDGQARPSHATKGVGDSPGPGWRLAVSDPLFSRTYGRLLHYENREVGDTRLPPRPVTACHVCKLLILRYLYPLMRQFVVVSHRLNVRQVRTGGYFGHLPLSQAGGWDVGPCYPRLCVTIT
jgi:hypothetical protein